VIFWDWKNKLEAGSMKLVVDKLAPSNSLPQTSNYNL